MPLERRKAIESDIPFLVLLRKETMSIHLAASGVQCSHESHLARVMYNFEHAEVLTQCDKPVGLLKVRRDPEIWEITQIQLSRQLQGNGIGHALLQEILADAADAGVAVKLSVLKANPARSLYERLGFKVVGEDSHEYFMLRAA